MPDLVLSFTVNNLNRTVDALCSNFGYQDIINGQPNPQTKNAFAKQQLIQWIKQRVHNYELATAQATVTVVDVDIT